MKRSWFALIVLLLAAIPMSGCHTVSGAAQGAADGAKKDYEAAKKTDAWLQENLW